ncbi:MAG: phage portal protein [Clostridiales bacterium]|nr:phage portal protein [Clostridiales bacterium]
MPTFFQRLQHGWNAFRGRDAPSHINTGPASYYRPDQIRLRVANDRSLITAIYNRIAMDVAANKIEHVKLDENGRYSETVEDGLNNCLTLEANIDQTSRAFIQDVVLSMFDDGYVAIVPTDTNVDPTKSTSFDIQTMRVGKILQWSPEYVRIRVYNHIRGIMEDVMFPKRMVALIQNPFYTIMNESNSTLQRLIHKLSILDAIDEQSGAGKLDLIIQLPYVVKSPARKEQAEARRKDIEMQLSGSKYGIAYTDGTERITQLNRPIENNLMGQIEYLMNTLYSQLGITPEILNGTASEEAMMNYTKRTVEPILSAIVDELKRKFLTKTARTQGHSIIFSSDPFRLVPISKVAEIAEKFVGNEVLSPNEVRAIVGFKPVADQQADELRNRRLNKEGDEQIASPALATNQGNQNGSENAESDNGSQPNGLDNIEANLTVGELSRILNEPESG